MTDNQMKLLAALVLFGTWVGLVAFKIQGADDLVTCIKAGLVGLGFYHIGDAAGQRRAAQFPDANPSQ